MQNFLFLSFQCNDFVLKVFSDGQDVLHLKQFRYKKISQSATVEDLVKELVRKMIHISSCFTVLLAHFFPVATKIFLLFGIAFYVLCELLRLNGKHVPVVSSITQIASRKADEGRFVFGPVTLGIGLLLSLLFFEQKISTLAIFSLSFGDGLASLVGKIYGQKHFKLVRKKTFEGSLACFIAVFVSTLFVLKNFWQSLVIALVATITELIPLKNLDNIVIPLLVGLSGILLGL